MSGLLDEAFRGIIREVVREEVRQALREQAPKVPEQNAATNEYLTVREAGLRARVDEATIRTWMRRGVLGTYRAGRVYRVKADELDRYLGRQAAPAPTADLRQRARAFLAARSSNK